MYTFSIGGKTASVFSAGEPGAPLLCLNTVAEEGQQVYEAARAAGSPPFTLVAIHNLDWNHDMAPWDSPAVFKRGEPFTGGADSYLRLLVETILPEAENNLPAPPAWRGIVGYSLAGLFALYAAYRTDRFSRVGVSPAPCGFPVLGNMSFPMNRHVSWTASTFPWGMGRRKPAIRPSKPWRKIPRRSGPFTGTKASTRCFGSLPATTSPERWNGRWPVSGGCCAGRPRAPIF